MISSTAGIEEYLHSTMLRLCSSSPGEHRILSPAAVDASRLFDMRAKFSDITDVLGRPFSSVPRKGSAPWSLEGSVEHRYHFTKWPNYDFLICESPAGYAWGQRFARATGSASPSIQAVSDLRRWSHTLEEVATILGLPDDREGWSEWESVTFALSDGRARLCFVFELLQTVVRV